ncbi:MAG: O-antigen ligase family protein, partial [Acidimicrobiales bacterium]
GLRQAHAERRSPLPWLGALAVLSAGIGVTYTRAGAIGQVALVVCLLLGRADRRALAPAALAVVLGLGIGGAAFGDGWIARGTTTVGADENTSADSTRGERWREARELVEANPLLGVGPGRYVEALAETERIEYLPAHDLVAQEAAELGILGGVAAFALLGLLGLRVLRGGAWTGAVVLPLVPFLLLDAYPYVFATGLAASAIWLGLARASLDPAEPEPEAVA